MARVGIVLPSTGFGGAERQAWLVAGRLREAGHEVAIFALAGGSGLAGHCAARALELHVLPRTESRWRLLAGLRLARAQRRLRAWRPEVLLPFCSAANVLCGMWADAGGPPTAWNQRDEGLFPQHPAHERRALGAARIRTANGPGAEAWLQARGCGEVCRVANAVVPDPPTADRAAWRNRLGVPPTAALAVMAATLSPAKDHGTLLEAWAQVEAALPTAWLALAGGDGGCGMELRRQAERLGLRRIAWAGQVEDIAGLLAASDLGVLSSRSEGLSNAVLEYRAAGLASVCSRIPGLEAAAGNGAALVPPGDAAALAGALLRLLADRDACAALASLAGTGLPGAEALDAWIGIVDDLLRSRR